MGEIELRDLYGGHIYHVCTNGTDCPVLMRCDEDYQSALNYLPIVAWRTSVQIAAYSIMSNHFHFLILCETRVQAQNFIKRFKQLISTYLSKKYDLKCPMKGIADSITLIDDMNYMRTCIAYILRNPVCARLCRTIDGYPWSSYACYFRRNNSIASNVILSEMSARERRRLLKIDRGLAGCPFRIDEMGVIIPQSFVRYDIVESAFGNSGKSFLYYLGHCNDSQMEYELAVKPQMRTADTELVCQVETLCQKYFPGKTLAQLTISNKTSMVKKLYYTNKTSIPQLSRVLGIPKSLVFTILSN